MSFSHNHPHLTAAATLIAIAAISVVGAGAIVVLVTQCEKIEMRRVHNLERSMRNNKYSKDNF